MAMSQLQQAMATLRLSLAEIRNKEEQLNGVIRQFKLQLQRLPRQVIYGRASLELSLSAMGEIEERLADAEATRRRLLEIKKRAQEELEALELVKQVDDARRKLTALKLQVAAGTASMFALEQIHQLEQFIAEHSKRAEWAITAAYQERHQL